MARESLPNLPTSLQTHTLPILVQVKDGVKNIGTTGAGAAVCIPGQVRVASPNQAPSMSQGSFIWLALPHTLRLQGP